MVDRKIDSVTSAIVVENYDNPLVSDLDQVAQNLRIRLRTFYGECFLDTTRGIPYFSETFTKGSKDARDAMIKSTIMETPEVTEILSYTSVDTPATRTMTVNFKARATLGTIQENNLILGA